MRSVGNRPFFLQRKRRKLNKGFPDDFFEPEKKVSLDGFN
jgi:hypothetical protein